FEFAAGQRPAERIALRREDEAVDEEEGSVAEAAKMFGQAFDLAAALNVLARPAKAAARSAVPTDSV
ncbi:MAG: hypothetical protein J0H54_01540, partial [Rhizobiales bacterium]|nr:hypothetical protein [Hyphomicrobiales bacterium]